MRAVGSRRLGSANAVAYLRLWLQMEELTTSLHGGPHPNFPTTRPPAPADDRSVNDSSPVIDETITLTMAEDGGVALLERTSDRSARHSGRPLSGQPGSRT